MDSPNSSNDDDVRVHGIYLGGKGFIDEKASVYYGDGLNTRLISKSNIRYSQELTGMTTFGENSLFEMGYNIGVGFYSPKAKSSAEIIIGLPRIGATSGNNVMWTPKVGLAFSYGPVDAEISFDFKVGKEYDFGMGAMVGVGI